MTSYINAFPGYEFVIGEDRKPHNMYRGVDLGLGGWVYTKPGIYSNVALLDVASLHPHSIVAMNKLGKYTSRYEDLMNARVYIKHKDFESASKLFDGKLAKYLEDKNQAKALSKALKLPINALYGCSFAAFPNPSRDSRDKNNIIALRGALFMKTLFDACEERGYEIVHVKTDSVKISNADADIVNFVQEFARKYGYEMEHEAVYDRICLIDKAQYIAAYMDPAKCTDIYGYAPGENVEYIEECGHPWTATGDEFQRPYIFKTLFSGEPIVFDDFCETNSVAKGAIYLDMNEGMPNVDIWEKELDRRITNANSPDKPKMKLNPKMADLSDDDIREEIAKGHNYQFIGRVGRFYPIAPGKGGGLQMVLRDGKYNSVSGSKGYRWLEAELVKNLHKEDDRDIRYHDEMVRSSIAKFNKFGSFDRFIDLSRPYEPTYIDIPAQDTSIVPCGDNNYNTCLECPQCENDICHRGYSLASYVEKGGEST